MKMSLWKSPVHFERVAASAHHQLYCTSCPGIFHSLEGLEKARRLVSLFWTSLTKKSVSILYLEQHSLLVTLSPVCISAVRRELLLWGDQISLLLHLAGMYTECSYEAAMGPCSWLIINRRTQKCLEYRKSQTVLNYLPSFICLPWRHRVAFYLEYITYFKIQEPFPLRCAKACLSNLPSVKYKQTISLKLCGCQYFYLRFHLSSSGFKGSQIPSRAARVSRICPPGLCCLCHEDVQGVHAGLTRSLSMAWRNTHWCQESLG